MIFKILINFSIIIVIRNVSYLLIVCLKIRMILLAPYFIGTPVLVYNIKLKFCNFDDKLARKFYEIHNVFCLQTARPLIV